MSRELELAKTIIDSAVKWQNGGDVDNYWECQYCNPLGVCEWRKNGKVTNPKAIALDEAVGNHRKQAELFPHEDDCPILIALEVIKENELP